ncbi:MAG: cell wall hydrolase [Nanoarchaeota archaeon]
MKNLAKVLTAGIVLTVGTMGGSATAPINSTNQTPQYQSQLASYTGDFCELNSDLARLKDKFAYQPGKKQVNLVDEIDLLATLAFEEAKDCPRDEKAAVMYTAINRLKEGRGKSLLYIVLEGNQYSCFNSYNPKKGKRVDIDKNHVEEWNECVEVAYEVLNGKYSDPTNGATNYFNPKKVNPEWQTELKKVQMPEKTVHEFYKNPTA